MRTKTIAEQTNKSNKILGISWVGSGDTEQDKFKMRKITVYPVSYISESKGQEGENLESKFEWETLQQDKGKEKKNNLEEIKWSSLAFQHRNIMGCTKG